MPQVPLEGLARGDELLAPPGGREAGQLDVVHGVGAHVHPLAVERADLGPGEEGAGAGPAGDDEERRGPAQAAQERRDRRHVVHVAVVKAQHDGPRGQRPSVLERAEERGESDR